MDTAHNKALVRRMLVDAFTAENPRALTEQLIAPDWINIDPSLPNVGRGPEGALRLITLFRAAFPDLVVEDLDMIAEGDRVAGHFAFSGTHQGELMGIPPTGRKVYVTATGLFRIADGKVAENRVNFDGLGMLQQLGVIPAQGPTA